ncbi:P-loop containing nucleoside triphosphate hydrolase protein [Amniculicola lignicola CBS 123094]|uniref:DNA 3'-5' helicase n=1 Tax=Amniculicola lignicola CBS 123094 TaxID=1392246 RepID=A0A6A5WSM2_9PLEO|nr:P-loop containing nucleoside triphosphate hydrolase protein [Amniculicola lignicola CBS 123094]
MTMYSRGTREAESSSKSQNRRKVIAVRAEQAKANAKPSSACPRSKPKRGLHMLVHPDNMINLDHAGVEEAEEDARSWGVDGILKGQESRIAVSQASHEPKLDVNNRSSSLNSMEHLLEGLNEAQKSAVTSQASVLQVLAPPGSGKTKTLTARVAYLVNHERLQPWNIIVCTFTIKAAREMKERIRGLVGDGVEGKLILGTFHSVSRRFLVRYGQEIGIDKNFGIADTNDSKSAIKRIVTRNHYTTDPGQARSRISGLKAKGITAEAFVATTKKAEEHEFACLYSEYEEYLRVSKLLDYDDLLLRCVELLRKHPACVSGIQAVLIDEYQDTNNVQYELMNLMAQWRKNITIVGDPDQSIYGFRSAEIQNLHRMRAEYPNSIVINLENNYRSSACILNAAMAVIEQDESRPEKPLIATHCVGEQPTLRHLATTQVEAQWIVDEITRSRTLAAGLVGFNDYAILLRSAALSLSIERALGKAGIPYRMVGGRRFFDRAEIKIVLDYLRVINQPNHNDAVLRVINVPSRKIGEPTIKALLEESESKMIPIWSLILDCAQGRSRPRTKISSQAQKGIDEFVNLVLTSAKKLRPDNGEDCYLIDLISHILQKTKFETYLRSTHKDNWRDRWANVEELVAQATQMASTTVSDTDDALPEVEGIEQRKDTAADILSKFLANVALSTEIERPDGEEISQVTISTIHAAKGLEWPIVFIPAVYEGSIPHSRAEDHDEERRLLYVGMTRAQGVLYLSCPVKQSAQEQTKLSKFVSSQKMQRFLSMRGPPFSAPVIQDLAQILRRACPATADLEAAKTKLERLDDDFYPVNREEIDGEDSKWHMSNPNNSGLQPSKKRKYDPPVTESRITAPITTHNSANYSVSKTTMPVEKSGFTSASTHMKILQEAKEIAQLTSMQSNPRARPGFKNERTMETKNTRVNGTKPRAAGQGSIASFFRSNSNTSQDIDPLPAPTKAPSLRQSHSFLTSQYTPSSDKSIMDPNTRPPARPYESDPSSTHRPRNTPMSNRPKRPSPGPGVNGTKYILLSSSPVKPDNLPTQSASEDVNKDGMAIGSASPTRVPNSEGSTNNNGFRPASTFHNTSVGDLQHNAAAPRRALGMRRPMQGWSVKHSGPARPKK